MTSKATSLHLTCKATLRRFGRLAVRATPRIGASASWSKDVFIMIFCSILWWMKMVTRRAVASRLGLASVRATFRRSGLAWEAID